MGRGLVMGAVLGLLVGVPGAMASRPLYDLRLAEAEVQGYARAMRAFLPAVAALERRMSAVEARCP